MRNLFRTVVLMCAALGFVSSCGSESSSGKVTYSCACAANCDGVESQASETLCLAPGSASQATSDASDACVDELTTCTEVSCVCVCESTGSTCS